MTFYAGYDIIQIIRMLRKGGYVMFEIKATNLHWLKGTDEIFDLCLHGDAWVRIGDECLEYEGATVSATAFYLLKSLLRSDPNDYRAAQYLPCCGHYMFLWQGEVVIMGCPNGVDWLVIHEGEQIRLITENKHETVLPFKEYKQIVFAFADEIEMFFRNSKEKVFDDEEDRQVYVAFWKEWHELRKAFA